MHKSKQRRDANRAAERAGQPPPYPKPSMVKEGQATYPGSRLASAVVVRPFPNSRRRGAPRASGLVHVVKAAAAGRLGGDGF